MNLLSRSLFLLALACSAWTQEASSPAASLQPFVERHALAGAVTLVATKDKMLSHTAGMRFSSPMEKPTLDMLTLRDAVRSYAMMPLQYEPDFKYQYSNAGINTAARILEVVSGMPYEEFMQKRLFDPLGMKDTT